jgi:hypothetical protein
MEQKRCGVGKAVKAAASVGLERCVRVCRQELNSGKKRNLRAFNYS